MIGTDSYYTPMPLADKLIIYVLNENIKTVIDFCVGDGDLLKAVRIRFKDVKFFGTDISQDAISKLANENVGWTLGVCDFRNDDSVKNLSFLKSASFDLIVLNPPFTCKGANVELVEFNGIKYKVSTAMMFVMKAVKYLSSIGAILPISCVYSQKDRIAWKLLQDQYNACVLEEPERVSFGHRCSPNIVLVYIGHSERVNVEKRSSLTLPSFAIDKVVRGGVRMQNLKYSKSKNAIRLIHTTNIQNRKLINLDRILPEKRLTVKSYGVIIPRVCNPNPQKIALLDDKNIYLLSDCIIMLQTSTMEEAEKIQTYILDHWSTFITLYKGTGAKYTTLERVRTFFGIK